MSWVVDWSEIHVGVVRQVPFEGLSHFWVLPDKLPAAANFSDIHSRKPRLIQGSLDFRF